MQIIKAKAKLSPIESRTMVESKDLERNCLAERSIKGIDYGSEAQGSARHLISDDQIQGRLSGPTTPALVQLTALVAVMSAVELTGPSKI
jgi:hypothetical protein